MIYYKNGEYHISHTKVHYKEVSEGEVIKFIGQEGKEWWEEFSRLWKDTFELMEFVEVKTTQEQQNRLDKVNELNLPEGVPLINEYIVTGKFEKELENGNTIYVDRGHPLYILKLEEDLGNMQKATLDLQKQMIIGGI